MQKRKKKTVKTVLCICVVVAVVAAGIWYIITTLDREEAFLENGQTSVSESFESSEDLLSISSYPTIAPTKMPSIQVHICGNVVNPGVVTVEQGSRLVLAIAAAGGFLWSADENYLNLARVVSDGERIYVPGYQETEKLSVKDKMEGTGIPGSENEDLENDDKNTEQNTIININTASVTELVKLPGIGESRARDIVAYRTKVGPFKEIKDITNISGIGEALFNRIKDMIRVN